MMQEYRLRDHEKPGREPRRDDDTDRRPEPWDDEVQDAQQPLATRGSDLDQEADDDTDDGQVDEQDEHPAVEEERRQLRRVGVPI